MTKVINVMAATIQRVLDTPTLLTMLEDMAEKAQRHAGDEDGQHYTGAVTGAWMALAVSDGVTLTDEMDAELSAVVLATLEGDRLTRLLEMETGYNW